MDDFVAAGYVLDRAIALISDIDGSHKIQTYIDNGNFDQRREISFFDLDKNGFDDIILANFSNYSIDTLLVKTRPGSATVDISPLAVSNCRKYSVAAAPTRCPFFLGESTDRLAWMSSSPVNLIQGSA